MRFAAALLALAFLTGCAQYDAARQANLEAAARARTAADDTTCRSSGAQPGSPAYNDCRRRLENRHAQETHSQERLANEMLNTPPPISPIGQ